MQDGVKDMDEDAGRKAQKIGLDSKLGEPQRPDFCSTSGKHERGIGAPARRSLGRDIFTHLNWRSFRMLPLASKQSVCWPMEDVRPEASS